MCLNRFHRWHKLSKITTTEKDENALTCNASINMIQFAHKDQTEFD